MSHHDEAIDLMNEIASLREAKKRALTIADERAKEAVDLRAQLASVRKALEFYADPYRYEGPNLSPLVNDPLQPVDLVYRLDVTRDFGHIARSALKDISK